MRRRATLEMVHCIEQGIKDIYTTSYRPQHKEACNFRFETLYWLGEWLDRISKKMKNNLRNQIGPEKDLSYYSLRHVVEKIDRRRCGRGANDAYGRRGGPAANDAYGRQGGRDAKDASSCPADCLLARRL